MGSLCRWLIGQWLTPQAFPWGTLTANALSSLVLGLTMGWLLAQGESAAAQPWRWLVVTGFCGGFSTYSSFTYDTLQLLQGGQYGWAFANVAGTFLLCVTVMGLGLWLMRG